MSEWRDIETAPKGPLNKYLHGPTILLVGGFSAVDGRSPVTTGYWKAARTNAWCDTRLGKFPLTPTHWMKLPEPPK